MTTSGADCDPREDRAGEFTERPGPGSAGGPPTGPVLPRAAGGARPERLGEFRILREVGHGGMGVVYEAVQESLGRHVALKILPFHQLTHPTHLERFRREARAAARLHHTNIVPVFGVGEQDGLHYFAMQFIQGQGLDVVLAELRRRRSAGDDPPPPQDDVTVSVAQGLLTGRFPVSGSAPDTPPGPADPTQAVSPPPAPSALAAQSETQYVRGVARLGVQVAEALDYAHRQGVLHRDVKPSNLLLDTAGTVWVTDFGLAKTDDNDELTGTGDIVGTLRYMAPERFQGQSDPRGDVYSLGVTLYELLTLQPAFAEADRARLIERILHDRPVPPRRRDRHIPRDLETVVLKALAREPGDRYAGGGDLAEDLRRFLADRPIQARRMSAAERCWRWCRRNPAVATLTAFVVVLAAALGLGLMVTALLRAQRNAALANLERAERAEDQSRRDHRRVAGLLDQVARAEKDRTRQLRDSYLDQARAVRLVPRGGRRYESLALLDRAVAVNRSLPADPTYRQKLRAEVLAGLALTDFREEGRLPWPAGVSMVGFSTDFRTYARSNARGDLSVRRIADDTEVVRLPGPGRPAWFLLFSRDGRHLAARYEDGRARVYDWARARLVLQTPPLGGYGLIDFSPDRATLALGVAGGAIAIYDLASGKERRRLAPGRLHSLAYHPQGRLLAASYLDSKAAVRIYDLDTGRYRMAPHPGVVRGLAWDPTGRLLATACGDHRVYVWDTVAGQRIASLEGHLAIPTQVAFSHRGDLLASAGWDGMVHLWNPLTGRPLSRRPGAYGSGFPRLQFSPDDRQLAFARQGDELGLWTISTGNVCQTFRPYQGPGSGFCFTVAFSPDGRLVATAAHEGVYLCDPASSRTVAFLPAATTYCARFAADGRSLVAGGTFGLARWPIAQAREKGVQTLTLGPPRLLAPGRALAAADFHWLADAGALAVADHVHGRVLTVPLAGRGKAVVLGPHPKTQNLAVSPDGRWIASGHFQGSVVKVWDARGARLVKEWPAANVFVAFSPDGHWLVTGTNQEYRFYEVGTWRRRHRVAREDAGSTLGPMAFSPDGRVLALLFRPNTVRLVVPATGQELATLTAPEDRVVQSLSFSPDGTRLAAACWGHVVQLWDLRRARSELARRRLDWALPAYPPAGPAPVPVPLRVRVEAGDLAPAEADEERAKPTAK